MRSPIREASCGARWSKRTAGVALSLALALAVLSACGDDAKTVALPTTTSRVPADEAPSTLSPPATGPPSVIVVIDGNVGRIPTTPASTKPSAFPDPATSQAAYLRTVFNDIQALWANEFAAAGLPYTPAKLVLFDSAVTTACGTETTEVGPFYCPADQTVYLDQQFFTTLHNQFGVGGDFAEAYVIAHELGHHVQMQLGITGRVGVASHALPSSANALSVASELQADCLAGVWAHSVYQRDQLNPGDIEQALNAAEVVGDDYLQKASGAPVDPASWTHGSSAQRQHWFTIGYQSGKAADCNTFTA